MSAFAASKAGDAYEAVKGMAGGAGDVFQDAKDQVVEGADAFVKMMEETGGRIKEEL